MRRVGAVVSPFPSPSRGLLHTTLSLRHMRRTPQSGGLPLHYAAAGGASVEVITFLLEAYKDAAAKGDKVRPTPPTALPYTTLTPSCLLTVVRRMRSCRCITPLRRATC